MDARIGEFQSLKMSTRELQIYAYWATAMFGNMLFAIVEALCVQIYISWAKTHPEKEPLHCLRC